MSIFNIFSKKNKLSEPVDLSVLKTDMHSHLIPGIDDGVETMDEAIDCLREISNLGYKKSIITPHVMGDYYKNTPETINGGLAELKKAVKEAGIDIEIEASAEYLVDDQLMDIVNSKQILTFGKNYVLIELSFFTPPENLKTLLFEMQIAGKTIILAHPERYSFWYHDFSKFEDLKNQSIHFQLNINSLVGAYSLPAKKIAEKFIDLGLYEFIGTDVHNINFFSKLEETRYQKSLLKLIESGKLLNHTL